MFDECIDKLIHNLKLSIKNDNLKNIKNDNYTINSLANSINLKKKPLMIDLVITGGACNGSFLIGCYYYLKKMVEMNLIIINRISTASISSLISVLYLIDDFDLMYILYNYFYNDATTTYKINTYKNLKYYLKKKITNNVLNKINNKLYISYYDLKKNKKIIRSYYKNADDLINSVIKSSFLPYIIDRKFCYKNKYIDGMSPFIFNNYNNINNNLKKTLFIDLLNFRNIFYVVSIKNEINNISRILTGIIDIHNFFFKNSQTVFCSYIEDWNIINKMGFSITLLIEKIIIIIAVLFFRFIYKFYKKYLNKVLYYNHNEFCVFIKKNINIIHSLIEYFYIKILQKYCI